MAYLFNVTFSADDPRALATFWAKALGYSVSHVSEDLVRLAPPAAVGGPDLLFLSGGDRSGSSTIHFDLATSEVLAEVTRLVDLGATTVDRHDPEGTPSWREANGIRWVVLRDPEANEFCVGGFPEQRAG